ncbi:uncharacterized protein LOC135500349 [Lineus longissimus]|uniref:uncharacterized protein LOC135500349 n=1 Tax=Lineus longissimus TaxID=88925 RepID=UPI002B4EC817
MLQRMSEMTTTALPTVMQALELVSTSSSTIKLKWAYNEYFYPNLISSQVYIQRHDSTHIDYSAMMGTDVTSYTIKNLQVNTHYKVCLAVYNDDALDLPSPERNCLDAMTTAWHIPVSIGSSIGAVLAFAIIVLIVLISQCKAKSFQSVHRRKSSRYDSQYDSTYESVTHDPESMHHHAEFSDITIQGPEDDVSYENDTSAMSSSDTHQQSNISNHIPQQHTNSRYLSADYAAELPGPSKPCEPPVQNDVRKDTKPSDKDVKFSDNKTDIKTDAKAEVKDVKRDVKDLKSDIKDIKRDGKDVKPVKPVNAKPRHIQLHLMGKSLANGRMITDHATCTRVHTV